MTKRTEDAIAATNEALQYPETGDLSEYEKLLRLAEVAHYEASLGKKHGNPHEGVHRLMFQQLKAQRLLCEVESAGLARVGHSLERGHETVELLWNEAKTVFE